MIGSLLDIPSMAEDLTRTISGSPGEAITSPRFVEDLSNAIASVLDHPASTAILAIEDAYWFAVALIGNLAAGRDIIIPGAMQAGAMKELTQGGAEVLRDPPPGDDPDWLHRGTFNSVIPGLRSRQPVITFTTSGSTGMPKRIVKSLTQLETEAKALEETWGGKIGGSAVFSMVSHRHIYGCLFQVIWPVMAGRQFGRQRFSTWDGLLNAIDGAVTVIGSPAHLSRIQEELPEFDDKKIIGIFSSGGPLDFASARRVADRFGETPMEVYGSTETGGIAHRQQFQKDTPWTPFAAIDCRITTRRTLEIRSPYLENRSWYETDDIVRIDDLGHFHLEGRVDRIVKLEGKRISLPEIEQRLGELDDVQAAAAVVLERGRKIVGAAVELTPEGRERRCRHGDLNFSRDLRGRLSSFVEPVGLPRQWRFVETIPVNSQGKRLTAVIEELFAQSGELITPADLGPPVVGSRETEEGWLIDLAIPGDPPYCEGHFPAFPVIPGIVLLDWAVKLTRDCLDATFIAGDVTQLKFRRVIPPSSQVRLLLEMIQGDMRFTYKINNDICASGQIKSDQT
jgi:3-hydroxymyristoyl/3-hydroxydecanoyl-(acyl carrier protein) dehydratase/phenylacetate-coenzyme A ligase PaaK-like adenylate-forming protein